MFTAHDRSRLTYLIILFLVPLHGIGIAAAQLPGSVPSTFVLKGKVLDPTGAPIVGVMISTGQPLISTRSDANGAFEITLTGGHHVIKVVSPGFREATADIEGVPGSEQVRDFVLAVASLRESVSVTAPGRPFQPGSPELGVLGTRPLLETPFSVNVLGRELMDAQQAMFYGDYMKNNPSAAVGNVPVGFMTLRGYSVGYTGYLYDGLFGNPSIGDGRYQLEGFERIEVLKGPSAFLNGLSNTSSSVGGYINFVPKRSTDTPLRTVTIGYVGESIMNVKGDLGGRFGASRQFGYRLNAGYSDGQTAVDRYRWTHNAVATAADWRVTPDLVLSGGYDYANNHLPELQPFFVVTPGLSVPAPPKASHNMSQTWDNFQVAAHTARGRADWVLSTTWSMTAQAMHGNNHRLPTREARFGFITSGAGDAFLFGSEDDYQTVADSGQAALHGTVRTGAIQHDITVGGSVGRERSEGFSQSFGTFDTNIYTPRDHPEPPPANGILGPQQKTDSAGLLVSDVVKFTDRWSAMVGGRYARFNVRSFDAPTGDELSKNSVAKFSPIAALMFNPSGRTLLYVNYTEGLDQGGQAPLGTVNANQFLPPIRTTQAEVGAKFEVNSLTLTAAYFNLMRPFEYVDTATLQYVQNGQQRHQGFEFMATGRLSSDLTIVAGTMLLNPRTNRTGDPQTEGKLAIGAPRVTANVFADYRIPMVPQVAFNAGVYVNGRQYLDNINTQPIDSWTRVDLGVRYERSIGQVRTAFLVNVENVANRDYWASAQGGILTLADPRVLKLSTRLTF